MRVGFCNGCFDKLHDGHKELLRFAIQNCDHLIVALNSDESVRRLKGADRPLRAFPDRLQDLKTFLSCYSVGHSIIPFEGRQDNLLMEIRPDVVIVGYDHYEGNQFLVMRGVGWKQGAPLTRIPVLVGPHLEGFSTTDLAKGVSK